MTKTQIAALRRKIKETGSNGVASMAGVTANTLFRVLAGENVHPRSEKKVAAYADQLERMG